MQKINILILQPEAKQDVVVTVKAASLWSENLDENLQRYILWHYIATKNGVLRFYPGVRAPKNFHPVTTTW